nr:IS5 family transposase [Roseomonas sp. 18066]
MDRQFDRARPSACRRGSKGGSDHAIGRSRGGLTTKIHAAVDGAGLPLVLLVSPGQASDKAAAPALIEHLQPGRDLVADRGYDARAILDLVAARGGQAHIPTQRDRKHQRSVPPELYRERNLVERFFNRMKHFRRIATRFDKLSRNYLAALHLVGSRLWLRHYESVT